MTIQNAVLQLVSSKNGNMEYVRNCSTETA
jgi:hypothetical protein